MDQRAHLRDLTATVVDLAVRGYLRLEEQGKTVWGRVQDYRLVQLKAPDGALKPHERKLLDGLFANAPPRAGQATVDLSDLETKFYDKLPDIRRALYQSLVQAGYFDGHPDTVRTAYLLLGGLLGAGLWIGLQASQPWHQVLGLAPAVAALLSALIVMAFSRIMPRRTLKGAHATDHIGGFQEFLRRADRDRLSRITESALFERYLPHALALGVATQWARAFEGLATQPPSWYQGDWDHFSPQDFGRNLNRTMTSMERTFVSQPRSSHSFGGSGGGGGGFSGGGGGGGGGGAW
jgi:hypothetical protein